jgi:MFS family permease
MSENSGKIKNVLIVAALSLATIAIMGDMVIIPVAENLFTDFHDVNMGILNYLLSGPALISAFASLLYGKLMSYIGKKKLLATSFAFFMAGSICGDVVHNAYYMAVMRSLVGVGMGGVMVLAIAIISDIFVDEKARSSVMGIYNGMMAGVGAILGWVSGMVAAVEWTLVFRIYLASIPIFLMILIFVPENKPAKPGWEAGPEGDAEKMPWSKLLPMNGAFFVYSTIYCIVYYQISMVITDKSIGDVAFIGILSALGTVGSFLCCCFFGLYYAKFKRFTPFVGFAGLALGFFFTFYCPRFGDGRDWLCFVRRNVWAWNNVLYDALHDDRSAFAGSHVHQCYYLYYGLRHFSVHLCESGLAASHEYVNHRNHTAPLRCACPWGGIVRYCGVERTQDSAGASCIRRDCYEQLEIRDPWQGTVPKSI